MSFPVGREAQEDAWCDGDQSSLADNEVSENIVLTSLTGKVSDDAQDGGNLSSITDKVSEATQLEHLFSLAGKEVSERII